MKIRCLELKNFRNHENTFMDFNKVNFIIGSNNSGKSSIKGGLQYAITGENEWAPNGRFAKNLIRYGEKEASAEVEIEGLGLVKRTIRNNGSVVELNNNKLPNRELEKEIYTDLELTNDVINCVIESSRFLRMSPSEQKDFLFRLTNAVLTPEQIVNFMSEPSEEAKKIVLDKIKKRVLIEDLDKLYKYFFEERRFKKRELKNLQTKLETIMEKVADESDVDIVLTTKQLEEQVSKRDLLLKRIAVISERENHKNRLIRILEDIERQIKKIEDRLDKSIDVSKAEETLFSLVTEVNNLELEMERYKTTYNTLNVQTKSLKSMLPKLLTTQCPLSEKITCRTDKSPLIEEMQKQIEENEKVMNDSKKQYRKLKKELDNITNKRKEIELQLKLAADLEDLSDRKNNIIKELEGIKIEDKSSLEAEFSKCELEIKKLEEDIKKHNEWVRARDVYEKLRKDFVKTRNEVKLYEYLVEEFSPKGVKQRILKKIIGPIQKYCNETLSTLTEGEYRIEFSFEDQFDIMIQNTTGKVSYRLLSSSEKLRIGVVIQDAINSLTNARLLIVDDVEMLDGNNFELFMEFIEEIEDRYDTIMVIATGDKYLMYAIKEKGYKVFKVKDGVVQEI